MTRAWGTALLLTCLASTAVARGRTCAEQVYESDFAPAVIEALQERHPRITDVRVVDHADDTVGVEVHDGRGWRSVVDTAIIYSIHDRALQTRVDVAPAYRHCGLNTLMLAYLLETHPEVERLDDVLAESNAEVFVLAMVTGEYERRALGRRLRRFHLDPLYRATVLTRFRTITTNARPESAAFRTRVLRAYEATPFGRTARTFGFGQTTRLVLREVDGANELEVEAEPGEFDDSQLTVAVMVPGRG